MSYLPTITEVLNDAAAIANTQFGQSREQPLKDRYQVLTETDLAVSQLLVERLSGIYPNHNILDEEAGAIDRGSTYTWVLDPIDGTMNFAVGSEDYGIIVGLLDGATPIAGGVILPAYNQLYLAERGSGATCNGQPIHVNNTVELSESLVAHDFNPNVDEPEVMERIGRQNVSLALACRNIRSSNSIRDVMLVARGTYGACIYQGGRIWDHVAGDVIVTEAGGIYSDLDGQPLDYTRPLEQSTTRMRGCGASRKLHPEVISILAQDA